MYDKSENAVGGGSCQHGTENATYGCGELDAGRTVIWFTNLVNLVKYFGTW